MCTMAQLINVYRQMVKCCHSVYGIELKEIFLYGSYARGDFNEDSDIAAIVKGDRMDLQEKLKKFEIYLRMLGWKTMLLFHLQLFHMMNLKNIKINFLII